MLSQFSWYLSFILCSACVCMLCLCINGVDMSGQACGCARAHLLVHLLGSPSLSCPRVSEHFLSDCGNQRQVQEDFQLICYVFSFSLITLRRCLFCCVQLYYYSTCVWIIAFSIVCVCVVVAIFFLSLVSFASFSSPFCLLHFSLRFLRLLLLLMQFKFLLPLLVET